MKPWFRLSFTCMYRASSFIASTAMLQHCRHWISATLQSLQDCYISRTTKMKACNIATLQERKVCEPVTLKTMQYCSHCIATTATLQPPKTISAAILQHCKPLTLRAGYRLLCREATKMWTAGISPAHHRHSSGIADTYSTSACHNHPLLLIGLVAERKTEKCLTK